VAALVPRDWGFHTCEQHFDLGRKSKLDAYSLPTTLNLALGHVATWA